MKCINRFMLRFSIIILFSLSMQNYTFAVEVNELDEITMQVLEADTANDLSIQQMVKIPIPINNELLTNSQTGNLNDLESTPRNVTKPQTINDTLETR